MKYFFKNIGYFLKEVGTILRLNPLSNLLSLVSTSLMFFILAMMIAGWWISNDVVEVIQGEAEINFYYHEDLQDEEIEELVNRVMTVDGVETALLINADEAYNRMVDILGKDAEVLKHFDDNPFNSFVEVKIDIHEIDAVISTLESIPEIENIRDNREILIRLREMGGLIKRIGLLVVVAVGVATLVAIAHIIRQGVYNNKEEINTLRLLGAPEGFIAMPFILEGLLLNLAGGLLAAVMTSFALMALYSQIQGPLPFIPMPPINGLIKGLVLMLILFSGTLGIAGSFLGLINSSKKGKIKVIKAMEQKK
ncbi:cell division protein FtsX [Alkaliphilus serpentinus]|uniref:Cell division protein FtsX n=1 Tax=Alkaliphilus serpentinus TaxID=1482731 RepID=A0A833HLR2_9FIRM|nr:permease-like cell division protein FtsX [Alkaliphilus serpentinus]KAB3526352.1 FtsX-like permease family protein [Alkaliphilus serpentinus]